MGTKAKTVIRSVLIGVLMVLVVLMMLEINRLQGTARVVNYAGLVRGCCATLFDQADKYMYENKIGEKQGRQD